MNEKFFALPREKQQRIINAGLEVFSKHDYKRASTDEIAVKAGISKGLLFYYFQNKKSFYLFLFEYVLELLEDMLKETEVYKVTDYFELLELGGKIKAKLLEMYPCLLEFAMHSYYSEKEEISEELSDRIQKRMDGAFQRYFMKIDFSKFKSEADPVQITKMLGWLGDGYLNELRRKGEPVIMTELLAEHHRWCDMFRKISYKEEYLNGEKGNCEN